MNDPERPIDEHLRELLRRALICAVAVAACAAAVAPLAPKVFHLLARPMAMHLPSATPFVALTPFEAWIVYFRIALIGGVVLATPIWLGQLFAFFRPALGRHLAHRIVIAGLLATLLFIGGAAFCYAAVLPAAFSWGIALLEGDGIRMMPQMSAYAALTLTLLVAFGLAFELPLVVASLIRLGLVGPAAIARARPHVIVGAFIVGAILTPPDVVSQICLAVPLYLLFELGLLLGRIAGHGVKSHGAKNNAPF